MSSIFRFKQFTIDQSDCAMKVNTDAVLLAALIDANDPSGILDIGTGTGVIALMLAQRYKSALIDAVEIDVKAASRASENFSNSDFSSRLTSYSASFEKFFEENPSRKYDLIISNPPFFINSLKSKDTLKDLARHTSELFFQDLIPASAFHLSPAGLLALILPLTTAGRVKSLCEKCGLHIQNEILIHSFLHSQPHRTLLTITADPVKQEIRKFVIYKQPGVYSNEYTNLLKGFLTIF